MVSDGRSDIAPAQAPGAPAQAPAAPPRSPFRISVLTYGVVPWLFLVSGIYMAILAAAVQSGVATGVIVSWFTVGSIAGGVVTILLSALYRQPVAVGFTTHGGLLAAAAMGHLSAAEASGGFILTAVLVLALAATGLASRLIDRLPLPIMLGMVLGVIFPFSLGAVGAVQQMPLVAGGAVVAFFVALRWLPRLGVPASFWAAAVGIALASIAGDARWSAATWQLGAPLFTAPAFTWRGVMELTLPLTVMVIAVHGTQSAGISRGAGFPYPSRVFTLAVGAGSLPAALFGAPPLCVMGPPLAMLVSGMKGRADDQRWTAAVVMGALLILLGVFAPMLTSVPLVLPAPVMATVAGLAVLEVVLGYLSRTFAGPFKFGSMVAFLVTAAKVSFLGVGSAFWGVVAGLVISGLLETEHFRPAPPQATGGGVPRAAGDGT